MSTELAEVITDPVLRNKLARIEMQHAPAAITSMSPVDLKSRYAAIKHVIADEMVEGVHYGKIPGTDKPALFKAGAEMLGVMFNLAFRFEDAQVLEDIQNGFFYYRLRCVLTTRDGTLVGSAEGSCNTRETKYRYRWQDADTPADESVKEAMKARGEGRFRKVWSGYGNNREQKWQWQERIENTEPYDLLNTVYKMAAKRAHVAAIRLALGVTDLFDVEEADESERRAPNPAELEADAKRALVKAVMQATGKSQKAAGSIAGDYWRERGLPIPYSTEQLQRLLVDVAVDLVRREQVPPEAPAADDVSPTSEDSTGASTPDTGFARSLGALLRGVEGPVKEFKERILEMDEAAQDEWLQVLKEADDREAVVRQLIESS